MTRFLFYVPGRTTPCGGVSVILDWVALLKKNGVSAEVVSEKPNYTYDFAESSFRPFFSAEIEKAHRAQMSRRERLELALGGGRRAGERSISVEESDVIVAPEFAANWLSQAFPRNRIVLLVQNPFWFKQPDYASLWDRDPFIATVSISDLCHDMSGMMGLSPCFMVPLAVDPTLFQPSEKTRTILYMPRRRPDEVSCVVNALKRRDRIAGYDLVSIDGLPIRKVGEMMGKGLVFLSFSEAEGFGLPPAEAMAAGCLVVGYTGAGGDEFFDPAWSFPVSDGNTPAFIETVEEIVAEYERDASRLDAMRHRAAVEIRNRYDPRKQEEELLDVFRKLS